MQELIEMLKEARSVSIASEDITQTYTNAIRLAESMLDKEKNQIIDTYIEGLSNKPKAFFSNLEAEQYYDKTFK